MVAEDVLQGLGCSGKCLLLLICFTSRPISTTVGVCFLPLSCWETLEAFIFRHRHPPSQNLAEHLGKLKMGFKNSWFQRKEWDLLPRKRYLFVYKEMSTEWARCRHCCLYRVHNGCRFDCVHQAYVGPQCCGQGFISPILSVPLWASPTGLLWESHEPRSLP